jgi:hypothetical protein
MQEPDFYRDGISALMAKLDNALVAEDSIEMKIH